MPRASLYMPAYEPKRDHIRAAVESVLAQTEADWELFINDDASTHEDTESHIKDFLSDPRIHFSRNSKNLGIGGNWNACLTFGCADTVAYLFHDDLWEPNYLKTMLSILDTHPSVGFASANHTYLIEGEVRTVPFYDEVHRFKQQHVREGTHHHEEMLRWWMEYGLRPNVIGEPSFVVLRKNLLEKVGPFNASMRQFLDSEYWVRCLLHADWYYEKELLGSFRVHPAGMSAQNEISGRGLFERFETFQMLLTALHGAKRRYAKRLLVKTLAQMIRRWRKRRGDGYAVSTSGSGNLKRFALRHPLLCLRACFASLQKSL